MIVTPEEDQIISAGSDCSIRIWEIDQENNNHMSLIEHTKSVTQLAISPQWSDKNKLLISCSEVSS